MALSTHDLSALNVHLLEVSTDTEREVVDRNPLMWSTQEGAIMIGFGGSAV